MADNVLVGADVFRFGPLELHGNLQRLSDTREQRVAVHEPLKRDGQKVERMGRKGHQFEASLFFVGPTWRDDLLRFQALVEDEPTRIMVHPVYGRLRMFCQKVGALVEPAAATNAATCSATFIENNVDTKLTATAADGVAARSQQVTAEIEATTTAFEAFPDSEDAGADLTDAAKEFRAATVAAFEGGAADASLTSKLDAVAVAVEAAVVALRADDLYDEDATIFPAIQAGERLYDACQLLRLAYLAERPPLIEYSVPSLVNIAVLAGQFYGIDGLGRIDEILANNPEIENPAAIPAGAVLKMATATV
jgi:prophage DNA circulation protein